jgi:iron complex transport system substrate-binding protein
MRITGRYPERIVCLTEETTETLYAIGAGELICGITEYTVRPEGVQNNHPVVARYIDADISEIIALKPDIVLAWSNLQADIAAALIKEGIEVVCFNHRSVQGILSMILKLGGLTGRTQAAKEYHDILSERVSGIKQKYAELDNSEKPKIYFEEWPKPIISAIGWVDELIGIAGGNHLFSHLSKRQDAGGRIIEDDIDIINANPDIILASWCGKPVRVKQITKRKGWGEITAIKDDAIYELPSATVLQPGPAALTDALDQMCRIFDEWRENIKI